jgi:ABC-type glycerol-3-phosphate transport system substrate-binding protein
VAPFPVDEPVYDAAAPITLIEADVLMIPKGCRHPEAAFEFVKFTQRREVHEKLAAGHCKPSGLSSVSADFIPNHPHKYIKVHNDLMQSPRARIQPRTRAWKEYNDLVMAAFEAIWSGADVSLQLAQAQARTQKVMDLSAERLRERRLSFAGEREFIA